MKRRCWATSRWATVKLGGDDQEGEAPTIQVRLKPETFFKLKKIARVQRITVSQVVRHLLEGRDVDTTE